MATRNDSPKPRPWSAVDVKELKLLVKLKRPTTEIAETLGRSPQAITSKIVSLRPARKAKAAKKGARTSGKKTGAKKSTAKKSTAKKSSGKKK